MSQNFRLSRVLSALLFGGFLVTYLLFRTNALYESSGEAVVSARVASFSVTASEPILLSSDNRLDCNIPGDSVIYAFNVENHSELSIDYEVEFSGLGSNVAFEMEHGSGALSPGESEVVTVCFSIIDETDRNQETDLSMASAVIRAVQKEASP